MTTGINTISSSKWILTVGTVALLFVAGCGSPPPDPVQTDDNTRTTAETDAPPEFRVDPFWPKPLPNNWILGSVTGVFVDSRQHIWVTHLPETLTAEETSAVQDPPIGTCCAPAPLVIEFDQDGGVVHRIRNWAW